jgi:serine/threonine-protein kinase HipA
MRRVGNIPYLLVERYDRILQGNHTISRIHQEDFCQALGVLTAQKYQNEGGPTLKDCFDLLRQTTSPVKDRNQMMQMVVVNYLLGNTDAHSKNFSLLHRSAQNIHMAPVYDVLCTQVYPRMSRKMAMKIGGKYEIGLVEARHWERLCLEVGFSYPALKKMLKEYAEKLIPIAQTVREELRDDGHDTTMADQILGFAEKQCKRTEELFN